MTYTKRGGAFPAIFVLGLLATTTVVSAGGINCAFLDLDENRDGFVTKAEVEAKYENSDSNWCDAIRASFKEDPNRKLNFDEFTKILTADSKVLDDQFHDDVETILKERNPFEENAKGKSEKSTESDTSKAKDTKSSSCSISSGSQGAYYILIILAALLVAMGARAREPRA